MTNVVNKEKYYEAFIETEDGKIYCLECASDTLAECKELALRFAKKFMERECSEIVSRMYEDDDYTIGDYYLVIDYGFENENEEFGFEAVIEQVFFKKLFVDEEEIHKEVEDNKEYSRDPYSYYGVSRSDFH